MSIGMTGTGKSFLVENYLSRYEYVVKLDIKHEYEERMLRGEPPWRGLIDQKDYTMIDNIHDLYYCDSKKIIYQPDFEEQNMENYDDFFRWCFERSNTVIWIDELMNIGTANRYPVQLKRCYTMGRSHGIGIWACTQQPSNIPTFCLANTRHFFVFNLMLPNDRKKIVETTGYPEFWELPQGHNFWYFKVGGDCPKKAILVERG